LSACTWKELCTPIENGFFNLPTIFSAQKSYQTQSKKPCSSLRQDLPRVIHLFVSISDYKLSAIGLPKALQ
jgi:hypothetical protein